MEGDPQAQAPAAEAPPAAPATTPQPASGGSAHRPFSLGRALGLPPSPASSEADPVAPPKDAPPKDGKPSEPSESTPSEPPKDGGPAAPTDDTPAPSPDTRRGGKEHANVARIRELEAEIASIKSATPADPDAERERIVAEAVERARAEERDRLERERTEAETGREREAVEAQERADAERFDRLNALPDDHPALADGDNWAWLQERKRLLAQFPQARTHYRTEAQRVIESARAGDAEQLAAEQRRFWDGVKADLASAKDVPGVDFDAVRAAANFAERDRILYGAGAASRDAELAERDAAISKHEQTIADLEEQIRDLRLVGPRGLGSARAPVTGGRSGAGGGAQSTFDPDRPARQNLAAALGFGTNGRQ